MHKNQPKNELIRLLRAFGYSAEGIAHAWRTQAAFRVEALVIAVFAPLALYLPVSPEGKALMIASLLLVLLVELINSAIEAAIDRISPEIHPLSKAAKDAGSAAVLLSLAIAASVWLILLF